jgi:hypothetical protein
MAEGSDERQVVLNARSHLPEWTNAARQRAYAELFAGDDAILSPADLRRLDEIDSALERQGGDGVWGTGQYGIHASGGSMDVVCVFHPQITSDTVLRGVDDVDDELEERLNDALWEYGERVAALIDEELDAFTG